MSELGRKIFGNTSDKIREGRKATPEGTDVFHWPEFRALMNRLGVDMNKTVCSFQLSFNPTTPVYVSITYEADDMKGEKIVLPPPVMNAPPDEPQGTRE